MIGFNLFLVCTILLSGSNANPINPELQSRTSEELTWDEAVKRGKDMDAKMNAATAVASVFTRFKDLETWGWQATSVEKPGVTTEFKFVEASPYHYQRKNSIEVMWDQNKDKVVDGKEYAYTGGFFKNIYSPLDRIILVENSHSPTYEYFEDLDSFDDPEGTGKNLVKLKSWSDVTFLEWKQQVENMNSGLDKKDELKPNRLQWVLRSTITHEGTLTIMEKAVNEKFNFEKWHKYASGVPFERGTEKFNALLGTAHGRGTAFMLIQHRSQLAKKRISKITIIGQQVDKTNKNPWSAGMLFEFEDIK